MNSRNFVAFCLLVAATTLGNVSVADDLRQQEILDCRPDEIVTWADGQDRPAASRSLLFSYDDRGAPPWMPETVVADAIRKAAQAWSDCGIRAGLADVRGGTPLAGTIVVAWDEAGSRGNFGLSNLDNHTLSLGPGAFQMLRTRNPAHDPRLTLQMVISHEMGHFFGLMAHSRRCVDVLSYYHDGRGNQCVRRGGIVGKGAGEYRHLLPTACDIARCRKVNGLASHNPEIAAELTC